MSNLMKYYINGEWVTPVSTTEMPVINPADESVIGTILLATDADVNLAVEAANAAFVSYARTSKKERLELLDSILQLSKERLAQMAKAMSTEMGAPMTMSLEMQADAAVGHLQGFIDALKAQETREILPGGDTQVREPIGVCGLIAPWNWPINQIVLKVLPPIATGCTCILKPSEFTPLSSVMYAELLHDAGVPAGVFNMIQGDGPTAGAALSRHPDIEMMSFTGSTRAGTSVAKDSADGIKRVTLELGGKSPNLVFADADLEKLVPEMVEFCYLNTGQSCDAPTRMLVERNCYDRVLEIAKKTAEETIVDDPAKEGNHLGPLISDIQFDRVQTMIEKGIAEGARLLVGGLGKPDGFDKGYWVKPTIFCDASNDMAIAQQEIFGPVLTIIPFDTEEEAIEIANDTPYGLAAYVLTGDPDRAERVAARLRVGAVHINAGWYNYGSPFGGYKHSGVGREGGIMGLEDFQEVKTLHFPK
jgi:aldehyde dehydrogenase (NAD+)